MSSEASFFPTLGASEIVALTTVGVDFALASVFRLALRACVLVLFATHSNLSIPQRLLIQRV